MAAPPATPESITEGRPKPAARKPADPRQVEELYQRGVEHYARGEFLQATAMFMRILQIDPDNQQAAKALERIKRR
jgi:tetratricopeptide (TPR) repeat protein